MSQSNIKSAKQKKKIKKVAIRYDSKLNRVTVIPTHNYGIHFGSDIRQIFGFNSVDNNRDKRKK